MLILGCIFLQYSAIMTRMKAHADDYNKVCEVLHTIITICYYTCIYSIGGCRYAEKGGLFFSINAPRISHPGTAYANIDRSRTLKSDAT